jgi:tRNA threonylcarbamoyl adenosine modification protein (Sua5/YciO/YrdC/YwlC family)
MPPIVIDLRSVEDPRDAVHRAVQALAEGQLVAFPTETVYALAASALSETAVERLRELKGSALERPLPLAIKSCDAALDYVPQMSSLGRRLARRCWPGPVTLVLPDDHPDSVVSQLPASVRNLVVSDGHLSLRVPAHPVLLSVLRLSAGPLVLSSAHRPAEPETVTGQEVVRALGDQVPLVLDDGSCKFGQPSSVARVVGNRVQMLSAGVINDTNMRRLSNFVILVVCTGNTCRSPMAEALLRHRIAERLGIPTDELDERGVIVMSAGIAAMAGGRSAPEAVQAMAERGLNLALHESQPLTERLARFADLILTMTRGHREAIRAQWPDAAERTFLLSRNQSDISDPIGGPQELYIRCAQQIDSELEHWLDRLDFDSQLASFESAP